MFATRYLIAVFSVGLMVVGVNVVSGQNYPNQAIHIVTSGAGSNTDTVARLIAQGISGPLGQSVIVDNRASGVIPGQIVSRARPDGYTLLLYTNTVWLGPLIQKATYDPVKDLLPISLTSRAALILVAHPSLPVNSVKELIALAKAKPGALNYSAGGMAGISQLAGELFKARAGLNIVHVPFKDGSQELAALVSGETQLSFGTGGQFLPLIKTGKLRAIAITSAQPSALLPGLTTMAASGLPGFEVILISGVLAPAKTPALIINRVNEEVVRVLNSADVKEKFRNNGVEAVGSSPQELEALIQGDMTNFGKLIKDLGLKAD